MVTQVCFLHGFLLHYMCVCENIYGSDKEQMLANGLVFIGKQSFVLAEPAEPSPGFRPCTRGFRQVWQNKHLT